MTPRRLIFTLASLTACAVSTLLMSTNFLGKDHYNTNNNEHDEELAEFDYMMGIGVPPPIDRSNRTLLPPHTWSEELPGGSRVVGRNESATTAVEENENESDAEEAATVAREVEGDEDNNDPRPKKNPKGERWRGWPKNDSPGRRAGDAPPKYEWWRNSRHCFAVDQICHRRKENEWFYYATTSPPRQLENYDDGRGGGSNALFQPNMELKSAPEKYDGGKDRGEKRISIKVSSSFKVKPAEISFEEDGLAYVKANSNDDRCRISSSTVHVVLQSLFNDMIGEFYARTLLGLYRLMKNGVVDANGNNEGKLLPWEEDIQFYVHIAYGNKQMVDGHKLLLSGMLSNPDSPPPKSFLDLFVLEEEGKHDDGDCQCYGKMVFCGYNVYTHDNDVLSKDMEPAVHVGDSEDIQEVRLISKEDDAPISRSFNYDPKTKFTLWSAARVGDSDLGSCGRSSNLDGEEYACQEWSGLRLHLAANFLTHYPTLERDIVEKRREYLLEKGFVDKGYRDNTDEFTVIGVTQRTYRRAWINLPDIIEKCNAAAFERVVCVEVNVEKTSSPLEQLILHRSLDVMIGVHGAQLTQGILLPPHAHVLELLPWIPDYIRKNHHVNQ